MRTGDIIKHLPSGETWVVAWADENHLVACGWPESSAKTNQCRLIKSCSDSEHWKLVEEVAGSDSGSNYSFRASACWHLLDRKRAAECEAMLHL